MRQEVWERSMEFQEDFDDAMWSSNDLGERSACAKAGTVFQRWVRWADRLQNTGLLTAEELDFMTMQLNRAFNRYEHHCGRFLRKKR